MDKCNGSCGLQLALARLFTCQHCGLAHCIVCLKKHAAELTMTYRTIPKLVVNS